MCVVVQALLDSAFHIAVAHASGDHLILKVISHILPAFKQSDRAVLNIAGHREDIENEHLQILKTIKTGDAAGAERAMDSYIHQVEIAF